MVLCLMTLTDL